MSTAALATREEWLTARRSGIGGSDAAAVLGVSPWKSRFSLWAEKTGLAVESPEETEAMEWGKRLEGVIGEKYAEVTGRAVARADQGIVRIHPLMPFMLGTVDFDVIDPKRGPGILEVKTLGPFRADEWSNEPPIHYAVQLQHYLAVTGAQWGSFAALIGGQRFVWCDVDRNPGFIEALEAECAEFWESVVKGNAPTVDGSDSTTEALKRLYPKDTGRVVELPTEAEEWWTEAQRCKDEIKRLETAKKESENRLKAAIGDASEAFVRGGPHWSYRVQSRASYVAEATEFRVLREMKGKKK
jgi:putative phage-type endonuclease